MIITPMVGRGVWYWSDVKQQAQPFAAIVTRVSNDHLVGLAIFHPDGMLFFRNECILVQDGDVRPEREFCEWMPTILSVKPLGEPIGVAPVPNGVASTTGHITGAITGVAGPIHDPEEPTL